METFSALLAICAGNSPVIGEFLAQRPMTRSFDVFFDLRLNKRLGNKGKAGDLRRHRTHYDVTVMQLYQWLHESLDLVSKWKTNGWLLRSVFQRKITAIYTNDNIIGKAIGVYIFG